MGTATAGGIKMSIFLTMLSNCFVCSDLALSAAGGAKVVRPHEKKKPL
jgi:hypothetical protein